MQSLAKSLTLLLIVSWLLTGCVAPANSPPVEPQAGHWQTWVLTAADDIQPPAPPDQAATRAELAELKTLAAGAEAAQALVTYWDAGSPSYRWIAIALAQFKSKPFPNPRIARGMSLMNVAIYDALVAAWQAKYLYNLPPGRRGWSGTGPSRGPKGDRARSGRWGDGKSLSLSVTYDELNCCRNQRSEAFFAKKASLQRVA